MLCASATRAGVRPKLSIYISWQLATNAGEKVTGLHCVKMTYYLLVTPLFSTLVKNTM
jgi:hypothetical protein